jgi:hypothetical protein
MGSLFSTPKPPKPQPLPPLPPAPPAAATVQQLAPPAIKETDKAVQEAVAEASRRRSRARGFRSTILSKAMPDGTPSLQTTLGS